MAIKRIVGVSKTTYRGHSLTEVERAGKVFIHMVWREKEYEFETLGEATGFLDSVAVLEGRVVVNIDGILPMIEQ